MKYIIAILFLTFCLAPVISEAVPTPPNRKVVWEKPNPEADLAGFWLYVAPQSQAEPRTYDDNNRFQIMDPTAREAIVIDLYQQATGGLCFKITAYDISGNESGFSNEACGWFGMAAPVNLGVIP